MTGYFTFDVVVPTYNNLGELKSCLRGLEKQTLHSFRVWVCVDGSTDGTFEFLSLTRYSMDLKVLFHPGRERKGRASTRNLCLKHLRSSYLCLLDSDVVPAPDLLEKHFSLLSENDCMSVGQILFTNSRKNFVAGYVETRGRGRYENRKTLPAFYFNTQNAALKSVHYIRSGGQDTSLDLSYGGDDSEFGYRVWKESGIPAIANQDAIAYSTEKKELGQMLNEMKCFGSVNLHAIHQKHPELKDLFHFQWMESHSLKTRLIRLLMRESLVENIQKRVPVIPGFIRNPIIHFLVFLNIGIGYLSAKRF